MVMASLYCSAPLTQFKLGFRRLSSSTPNRSSTNALNFQSNLLPTCSFFRYKYSAKYQIKQRFVTVFTSNATQSEGDAITEKSNETKTGDGTSKGPPLLTILAGFLVLALIIWIIGSVVMWLFSLVFTVPPSPSPSPV